MKTPPNKDAVQLDVRGSGAFDVVIVGGGSAGAVLARRLTGDPVRKVLLLEAGEAYAPDHYPDVIANADHVGGDEKHDWGFTAHAGPLGRQIRAPRGKVLGGSSGVNAAVAIRARASDFAKWTGRGLAGWSFPEVLETYKALENTRDGDDQFRGRSGPFPVRQRTYGALTPSLRAFIDASVHQGFSRVEDFNGGVQHGVGPYPLNVICRHSAEYRDRVSERRGPPPSQPDDSRSDRSRSCADQWQERDRPRVRRRIELPRRGRHPFGRHVRERGHPDAIRAWPCRRSASLRHRGGR